MNLDYEAIKTIVFPTIAVLLLILYVHTELGSRSWRKDAGKVVHECYMPDVEHRILGVATLADGSHVITTVPVSDASDIRAYKIDPGVAPICGSVVARLYYPQTRSLHLTRVR